VTRVAVLKGGRSLERQVSLRSGARIEAALERVGHEVTPIDVRGDLVRQLGAIDPEVAFIALHGREAEDGTVQELLEVLGIAHTGSSASACSRCWDKVLAKHLLRDAGLPTPDFHSFSEAAFRELGAAEALPAIEQRLSFPIVVKPARGGLALGMKFASSATQMPGALVAAFSFDRKVLLERHVAGQDVVVSVLDGRALPPFCHAPLCDEDVARAQELALQAWTLFACRGAARVDLMRSDADGELTVLEVTCVPSLAEDSRMSAAAREAELPFETLVDRLVAVARPGVAAVR
jgi:D-alanine-D-alanine ligase